MVAVSHSLNPIVTSASAADATTDLSPKQCIIPAVAWNSVLLRNPIIPTIGRRQFAVPK
jgi:hypothetical protein